MASVSQQCGAENAAVKSPFGFVFEAVGLAQESKITRACSSVPRVVPEPPSPAAVASPSPRAGSRGRPDPRRTRPGGIAPSPGAVDLRVLTAQETKYYLFRATGI